MAGTPEGQSARRKAWREKATRAIMARLKEIGAPPDGFAAFEPGGSRFEPAAQQTSSALTDIGLAVTEKLTEERAQGASNASTEPPEEFYEWFSGMLPPTPVPGVDYWDPLRDGLIQALQWAAQERGKNITLWDFCQLARVTEQLITDRFGSWGRLRKAAGLPPPAGKPRTYHDGDVIAALRQLAAEAGPDVSLAMLHQRTGITSGTIQRRFGGWTKLCERAGVRPRGRRRQHSPQSILQALTRLVEAGHNRITQPDFARLTGISMTAILYHWGRWSALRQAAGLPRHEVPPPRHSDDDLLAEFDRVTRKLGRAPSDNDFDAESCYNMATLRARFGRKAEILKRWQQWRSRQPVRKRPQPRKKCKRRETQRKPSRRRDQPRQGR